MCNGQDMIGYVKNAVYLSSFSSLNFHMHTFDMYVATYQNDTLKALRGADIKKYTLSAIINIFLQWSRNGIVKNAVNLSFLFIIKPSHAHL